MRAIRSAAVRFKKVKWELLAAAVLDNCSGAEVARTAVQPSVLLNARD